jgi:hypothetical protein
VHRREDQQGQRDEQRQAAGDAGDHDSLSFSGL